MRSGYIASNSGLLWYVGSDGFCWPSSATSNIWGSAGSGAYYIDFDAAAVYASSGPTSRGYSFSLRCLNTIISLTTILYFVRSGFIAQDNGHLWYASSSGLYWPSSTSSNVWDDAGFGARYLSFNTTGINPSDGPADRWYGFPSAAYNIITTNSILRAQRVYWFVER